MALLSRRATLQDANDSLQCKELRRRSITNDTLGDGGLLFHFVIDGGALALLHRYGQFHHDLEMLAQRGKL